MATYRTLKRNIGRNIKPYYSGQPITMPNFIWRIISFLLATLIAVSIPVFTLAASANLIFRIPDLYSFDLSRTNILKDENLKVKPSDIGGLINSYMLHKSDDLSLIAESNGKKYQLFTRDDREAISSLRAFLDRTIPFGASAAAAMIISFVILFFMNRNKYIRRAFGIGSFISLSSLVFFAFAILYGPVSDYIWHVFLGIGPSAANSFMLLFSDWFFPSCLIAGSLITIAILVILGSVVFALTRNREKMF